MYNIRRADGLWFKLPDDLKAAYLSFGNDLAVRYGEVSWTLPMPGRFVVDRGGVVRTADVDPDYESRPEPQQTVGDIKRWREEVCLILRRLSRQAAPRRPASAGIAPKNCWK